MSKHPVSPLWVIAILALHLALAALYSLAVPPWEAHDEWAHYKFVEYVARHRALPPPDQRLTDEYQFDEASQPPLYYLLAALPVLLVDTSDVAAPDVNPYFGAGDGAGGINAAVHHANQEGFPWRGTLLALRLARAVSLLIGTAGLLAVWALGRLLAPERPLVALLALMIAAFSPQYLFISSVVTNDVLIAALGCAVAWLGAHVVLRGPRPLAVLGLTLVFGLALLTKLSALALAPFVVLALIASALRARRHGTRPLAAWLIVLLPLAGAVLAAGLWLLRNFELTGGILPRDPWVVFRFVDRYFARSGDTPPMRLDALPSALVYAFRTFWASFGWGNLAAWPWVYWFFAALCLVGVMGLTWWAVRHVPGASEVPGTSSMRARKLVAALLALLAASVLFMAAYRDFDYGGHLIRGRYLLPALGAVAALIALGLDALWEIVQNAAAGLSLRGAGCATKQSHPMRRSAFPGEMPMAPGFEALAGLAGDARNRLKPLVQKNGRPFSGQGARGVRPSSALPTLGLGVALVALNIALPLGVILPAYAPPPALADASLRPREQPLAVRFGDAAELMAYEIWPAKVKQGDGLGVALLWRTLGPTDRNYTLGIHLLDAAERKVGELNVYPGRGNYATTVWRPGYTFREVYWVPVREAITEPILGQVKVALFRDDASQAHLPVSDSQGQPLGGAVQFGRLKLAPAAPPGDPPAGPGLATLGGAIRLSAAEWQAAGAGLLTVPPGLPTVPPLLPLGPVSQPCPTLAVTLTWDALARPAADYQVFVHLRDDTGPRAFGDGPPAEGRYPTGLWERGERSFSQHTVTLPADMPAGRYRLVVGMYNAAGRLPAADPVGVRLRDDEIMLGEVTVVRQDRRNYIPLIVNESGD